MVEKYSFELFQVHVHLHIMVGRQEMGQKRYWFYFWYRSNRLIVKKKKYTVYTFYARMCVWITKKAAVLFISKV